MTTGPLLWMYLTETCLHRKYLMSLVALGRSTQSVLNENSLNKKCKIVT